MTLPEELHAAPIGVIETTPDGEVIDVTERAGELIGGRPAEIRGRDIEDSFPKSAAGTLGAVFDGEDIEDAGFEEYYPQIDRWLAVEVAVAETVTVYVRDRTERHARERTIDGLRDRLARVQEINDLVVTVLGRVIGAANREDVGRTMCERLGGADLYGFAWVGERDVPDDRLRSLAAAGSATDLEQHLEAAMRTETTLPEQRAVLTGETQHVEALAGDESIPEGVRKAAFGNGLQSCLAIPLAYTDTVYGVVSVYSRKEDGFSEQERVGLETLASVAGFAIRALRQEGIILADTVTEVTLAISDETLPFARAARAAETALELDGAVPRGDGAVVCYLSGEDLASGGQEALAAAGEIADVRVIGEASDRGLEATVTGETPITRLVGWGATVRDAEYTPESARVVAELPPDGDVRRLVEAVDDTVADIELLAKSETTPSVDSVDSFRDRLDERLTDRQQAVLRTAYLADYFATPRASTSEEVAETLDIAGSTLLYHLRRAEQDLVGTYLEQTRRRSAGEDT